MNTIDCLSEDTLLAVLDGKLAPEDQRRVDEHLSNCEACLRLVAVSSEDRTAESEEEPPAEELAPDRADSAHHISRYRVTGPIGAGGAGVVYSALDPELGRPVALKLLHAETRAGSDGRSRVLREAQAMARLTHANVVAIYDVGTWREQVFIAMELVEGGTLREWQTSSPRKWREILQVYLAAGRGLAAAHAAGLVHRDFKPDNVLVAPDGRVLVTDFGLAREAEAGPEPRPIGNMTITSTSPATSTLTPIGALVGTPAYMSPEQLDGAPASAASDLFSFCVALYEALHGVRPFEGRTVFAVRNAIRAGKVREPRREKQVPDWLHRLVVSGLRADPAARPPSMDALLAGLQVDPQRKRRQLAGVLLLALLCAGVGVMMERAASARASSCKGEAAIVESAWSPSRREAMRARFEASGLPYAAASFTAASELLDRYARDWSAMRTSSCEATRVRREQPAETFALRAACLDRRRGELGALTDLFLNADKKIIEHAVAAASSLGELDECANVTALAAPIPPPRDPAIKARLDAALTKIDEAAAQWRTKVITKATIALATPALEEIRAIGHAPSMAYAEQIVGNITLRVGEQEQARELCESALYDGTRGRDTRQVLDALRCLTSLFGELLGRLDDGLRYNQLALATVEGFGNRPSDVVDAKLGRANLLLIAGRLDEALAIEHEGIAALEKRDGANCVRCLESRSNMGQVLMAQGRFEEARATFAEVLPAIEKMFGVGHPETLPPKINLGSTLLNLGRIDAAAPILESMPTEFAATHGEHYLYFAVALILQGELRLARGQSAEGLSIEDRAISIIEAISPEHPALVEPLKEAGLALVALGRAEESLPLFERALAIAKGGIAPTDLAQIQFALARALLALHKDPDRAAELVSAGRKAYADAAAHWGGENARLADELAPVIATPVIATPMIATPR